MNIEDNEGQTALSYAFENYKNNCIKALLTHKDIDIYTIDALRNTLTFYDGLNFPARFHPLLEYLEGNINEYNKQVGYFLHRAIIRSNIGIVKFLLSLKMVNISPLEYHGRKPLDIAELMTHLCDKCTHSSDDIFLGWKKRYHLIYSLIQLRAETSSDEFIAKAYSLSNDRFDHYHSNDSFTLLHFAAQNGECVLLQSIIDNHLIHINLQTSEYGCNHNTPLHLAALSGHTECVRILLSQPEIKCSIRNVYGKTPLHLALENHNVECIKLLVEHSNANMNPEMSVDQSSTAIIREDHWLRNNTEVNSLIDFSLFDVDKFGNTKLHKAAETGDIETMRLNERYKFAKVNARNGSGETPLHKAASSGHAECLKFLFSHKHADVNMAANNGNTPLHCAVRGGHLECVAALLSNKNVYVNIINRSKQTPLAIAQTLPSVIGNVIIQLLIAHGATLHGYTYSFLKQYT